MGGNTHEFWLLTQIQRSIFFFGDELVCLIHSCFFKMVKPLACKFYMYCSSEEKRFHCCFDFLFRIYTRVHQFAQLIVKFLAGLKFFSGEKSTRLLDFCSSKSLLHRDFVYKSRIKMKKDKNQNENTVLSSKLFHLLESKTDLYCLMGDTQQD